MLSENFLTTSLMMLLYLRRNESEKGFNFFQKFMKSSGAIDRLEELGIEEGDTVRVGDYLEFDYYRA